MHEKNSPYPNAPGYPAPDENTLQGDAHNVADDPAIDARTSRKAYEAGGHFYSADSTDNLLASAGVRRIEAINEQFTRVDRWIVFLSVFLVAYCYGLDGTVRYTYQVRWAGL